MVLQINPIVQRMTRVLQTAFESTIQVVVMQSDNVVAQFNVVIQASWTFLKKENKFVYIKTIGKIGKLTYEALQQIRLIQLAELHRHQTL